MKDMKELLKEFWKEFNQVRKNKKIFNDWQELEEYLQKINAKIVDVDYEPWFCYQGPGDYGERGLIVTIKFRDGLIKSRKFYQYRYQNSLGETRTKIAIDD